MAIEHKDITGVDVHEPKGIEAASDGTVYKANGLGSGSWANPLVGINNLNSFQRDLSIDDISTLDSRAYLVVPNNSTLTKLTGILHGAITAANSIVSIYRDGLLLGQTMTVPFAGSGAGVKTVLTLAPAYSFTAGQTLELRSNGGSTDASRFDVTLEFTAA